jgi:hypothetical protein
MGCAFTGTIIIGTTTNGAKPGRLHFPAPSRHDCLSIQEDPPCKEVIES